MLKNSTHNTTDTDTFKKFENFFKGLGDLPPEDELEPMELDQFLDGLSQTLENAGYDLDRLTAPKPAKATTITVRPDTNPHNQKKIPVEHYERGFGTTKYYTPEQFKELYKQSACECRKARKKFVEKYGVYVSSPYYLEEVEYPFPNSGYENWDDYCANWFENQFESDNLMLICNNPKPLYMVKDDVFDNDWADTDDSNDGYNAILNCLFGMEKQSDEYMTKYSDLSFHMGTLFHVFNDGLKLADEGELYENGIEVDA